MNVPRATIAKQMTHIRTPTKFLIDTLICLQSLRRPAGEASLSGLSLW
ncbi:hypothetical protein BAY15_2271 [Stenotrophomonas rhizophila]|nr:hypothetical protein BAY15_2271 [Stenotrophomonas rhizophila]